MLKVWMSILVVLCVAAQVHSQDAKSRHDRIDPYVFGGCTTWFDYEDAITTEIGGESDGASVGCSIGIGFPTFDKWGLELSYGKPPNIKTLQTMLGPNANEVQVESKQGTDFWSLKALVEQRFNNWAFGISKLGISYTTQTLTARPVAEDTEELPTVSDSKSYMDPTLSLGLKFRVAEAKTAPRGAIDLVFLYTKHINADIFSDGIEFNFRVSF